MLVSKWLGRILDFSERICIRLAYFFCMFNRVHWWLHQDLGYSLLLLQFTGLGVNIWLLRFFLSEFWYAVLFKNLVLSISVVEFVSINLSIIFHYFLNFWRFRSDILLFYSWYQSFVFSLFSITFAKGLLNLLFFQTTSFWFVSLFFFSNLSLDFISVIFALYCFLLTLVGIYFF